MTKSNGLYKNIFLCFFVLLFSHIALYNATFSVVCYILIPATIAYCVYCFGLLGASILSLGTLIFNVIVMLSTNFPDMYFVISTTLSLIFPGIICGLCITKKFKAYEIVVAVTLSIIIFPLIELAYAKYVDGYNFFETLSETMNYFLNQQFQIMESIYPEFDKLIDGNINAYISRLSIYIPGILPGLYIIFAIAYSVLIFAISKSFLRRDMIRNSFFIQGVDCIYLPKISTIPLIIAMVFVMLETDLLTVMVFINFFMVLFAFYILQGLSLVEYFLKQKNLNAFSRILAILGIIIGLTMISLIAPILNPVFVLGFLGLSDCSGDYRKLNVNKDEFNEN